MLSNYLTISSSHSQIIRLVQTVRTTRAAAIQALELQYQRMLSSPPPKNPDTRLPVPPPRSAHRSRSSSSSSSGTSSQTNEKPEQKHNPNINKLFCRYAQNLQCDAYLPLICNFKLGGNSRCPSCRTYIPIRPNKAWEVIAESSGRWRQRRKFLVRNRFVIKCHRRGGGFACILCAKYGEADTVCREIGALMEHLWKEHTSEDLNQDEDITAC
jgi:hypothetical protein